MGGCVKKRRRDGRDVLVIEFTYVDKDGQRQRYRRDATIQRAAAANAEADQLRLRALTGGTLLARERPESFAEYVKNTYRLVFLPRHKPGTRKRYDALLRQGILDFFGRLPLDKIGEMTFRSWAVELEKRGAGASIRHHWSFIRTVLRSAVTAGKLERIPALPKLPPIPSKLPDGPTLADVERLLAVATGWIRVAVALAVYAGLRSGEVRALERRDIDLDRNLLFIRRAFSESEVVLPKDLDERLIPLSPQLRAILVDAVRGKLPGARLVVTSTGATPTRQGVYAAVVAVQKRHGLQHRSYHANRHGFLSELVRRGASIEAVRLLAGHARLETTQRYVHATARDLEVTIGLLGGNDKETAKAGNA